MNISFPFFRRSPVFNLVVSILISALLLPAVSVKAVSVKEFGAAGDGETDDSGAFRAAILEAGRTDGVVRIPSGRYLLRGNLSIGEKVSFIGEGDERSIITGNGRNARILVETSGTSFENLGFEQMIDPIGLVSRAGYTLKEISFDRCRFEDMEIINREQGVISLSSSSSSQRPHRIDGLKVRNSIFRNIRSAAINIRGNISGAEIINNQFLDISNKISDQNGLADWELGGYAIRLGESSDDAGMKEVYAGQGNHLIENNVIRNLTKRTVRGNLKAMLLYGNYTKVRNNLFEDIDGGIDGDDVNAMYFRGAFNEISGNTIRNVRGSDDDGSVSFKGGLDLGNQGHKVFHNYLENIIGMSAIEAASSDIEIYENEIVNAALRGVYHRAGENAIIRDNIFRNADTDLRTEAGDVIVSGNWYLDSVLWLSQRRAFPSYRDSVHVFENLFQRKNGSNAIFIRFSNNPEESFVSVRNNRFEYLNDDRGGDVIDLRANGNLREIEIIDNRVEQKGKASFGFSTNSPRERIAGNVFSSGGSFTDTERGDGNDPGIPEAPLEPVEPEVPEDFRIVLNGDSELLLIWSSRPDERYQVQYSSDLREWHDFGEPIFGDGTEKVVDRLPIGEKRATFYRLEISSG